MCCLAGCNSSKPPTAKDGGPNGSDGGTCADGSAPPCPCPCPPCPKYDSINAPSDLTSFNCAGLALRSYSYVGLAVLKSALGAALGDCSQHCAACQVKFWLWEWDPWSLEFKDATGRVWVSRNMPSDFHTVSGRCDCHGNDPATVNSKNGKRPLEGPAPPSSWRVKTGDVWTENAPTNRQLCLSVSAAQISATPGLNASDLYLGSAISSGVDMNTGGDVQATQRYLKCFVKISDKQSCYCKPC